MTPTDQFSPVGHLSTVIDLSQATTTSGGRIRRGIDGTEEEQHTDLCLYQCLFPHRAKIQESRPGFDHHIWRTSFILWLEFPSPARLSRMPHHHTQFLTRLSWLSPSTSSPTGPAATIVTISWSEDFPIGYGAKPAASDHCPTLAPPQQLAASSLQTASLVRLQERPTARYMVTHRPIPSRTGP